MTRHVIRVAVSRYSSAFLPVFADDPAVFLSVSFVILSVSEESVTDASLRSA